MGDLVSLRMLVVGASDTDSVLWRQGSALASVPVEFLAIDAPSAPSILANSGVDICVVDGDLPDDHKAVVVAAARAVKPAPLLFVSARHHDARIDGADGMLAKPASVEDARRRAELCIRAKIPTRVLIVDDSSTMRSIVRKILAASRFPLDIYDAAEGIGALNQLRNGNFGLVFLDYNMPGFNGIETLSEIKRENPNVAVVMMTSAVDNAIVARAQAAGALAFLKKPFFPSHIDAMLERYYGFTIPAI
jgi:DNA-binding NarL/FixJ family response regulator